MNCSLCKKQFIYKNNCECNICIKYSNNSNEDSDLYLEQFETFKEHEEMNIKLSILCDNPLCYSRICYICNKKYSLVPSSKFDKIQVWSNRINIQCLDCKNNNGIFIANSA